MCGCVQVCKCSQACVGVFRCMRVYAGMHGCVPLFVQVCTGGVRVYEGVHRSMWVYMGVCGCTRVYTGLSGCTRVCAQVCTGACACVGLILRIPTGDLSPNISGL